MQIAEYYEALCISELHRRGVRIERCWIATLPTMTRPTTDLGAYACERQSSHLAYGVLGPLRSNDQTKLSLDQDHSQYRYAADIKDD